MALTDGIISYYKCSSDATDELGTNNGTNNGTVTYSSGNGKIGNGAGIDGASPLANYVSLGTGASLVPTAITINGWGKYVTPAEIWGALYHKYRTTGDEHHLIMVSNTTNKVFWLVSATTDLVVVAGNATLSSGTYYMFTMTYDSTDGLKTYINASDDGTVVANGNLKTGTQNNVYIGGDVAGSNNGRPWASAFDEFGIWNRALTASEITELFNSGAGLQYPFTGDATVFPHPTLLTLGVG